MYLKNFITSGLFVLTFISLTAQNYQLKTMAISMQVNGNIKTGEKLHFTWKHTIVLPDYNIVPPKVLMGTVVVGKEANLTLAGMKRKIDLLVTISHPLSNVYRFTAKKSLLLTDFGLTPPTVLLGMVKVRNEITLDIDIYVSAYSTPSS